jgi:replicative DNA helicase
MSKLFEDTFNRIKENKKNKDEGKYNCIPFDWLPKLKTVIPGIMKGTNWIVTASSGVGKTQFTKDMFVYKPIKWVKEHPEAGIKYKVLYFALEESKEEFMLTMISNRLYHKYGLRIDVLTLQSYFDEGIPDNIISKIEECREYFQDLEDYIEIFDAVSNPTGIYKAVRRHSIENGTHYWYNFKTDKEKKNPIKYDDYVKLADQSDYGYSHYEPNDLNTYFTIIVDHFSLLQPEKGADTLHQAMTKMSAEYGRKNITKHWGYVFVNVQQQSADGEKAEFTKMGGKIEEKFKPTLAGLADNKLTQRDAHVVLGLFSPARHNIANYNGYNINILRDNFRSVEVLKNRIGSGYIEDALYFNGAVNEFRELPRASELQEKDYAYVEEQRKKTI